MSFLFILAFLIKFVTPVDYHIPSFELSNRVKIQSLGLRTILMNSNEAQKSVEFVLKIGCGLIDTANTYHNEKAVEQTIKHSDILRKDIFFSIKLWAQIIM